jgi:hypothetical protein
VYQIHQPAAKRVKFPTNVIAACSVTSHSKEAGLSKKCQVQAHIALTKAGNMAQDKALQARLLVTSPYVQINQIAAIHSITLET